MVFESINAYLLHMEGRDTVIYPVTMVSMFYRSEDPTGTLTPWQWAYVCACVLVYV